MCTPITLVLVLQCRQTPHLLLLFLPLLPLVGAAIVVVLAAAGRWPLVSLDRLSLGRLLLLAHFVFNSCVLDYEEPHQTGVAATALAMKRCGRSLTAEITWMLLVVQTLRGGRQLRWEILCRQSLLWGGSLKRHKGDNREHSRTLSSRINMLMPLMPLFCCQRLVGAASRACPVPNVKASQTTVLLSCRLPAPCLHVRRNIQGNTITAGT